MYVEDFAILYDGSPIIGKTIAEVEQEYGIKVKYVFVHEEKKVIKPNPNYSIKAVSILRFYGEPDKMIRFKGRLHDKRSMQ